MDNEHWITTKAVITAHSRFLAACCEYTGMDEKTALALSAGFGGGARSGELCGAVTGAIMAEGLVFPFNDGQDTEAKDKIAAIAKQCVAIARESTAMCAAQI